MRIIIRWRVRATAQHCHPERSEGSPAATERAKSRPGSVLRSDCGGRPCGPTPLRCSVCGRAA